MLHRSLKTLRTLAIALKRNVLNVVERNKTHQNVWVEREVNLEGCAMLATVRVGFRSYANDSLLRNVEIGRFCSIGRRCSIGAPKHPLESISTHPYMISDGFETSPITRIGHDVWIGDNVIIIAGLTIGDGAVVGAGSVVTKPVKPYSIVAGVPARFLRFRFSNEIIEQLIAARWWDFGDAARQSKTHDAQETLQFLQRNAFPTLANHFKRVCR